MWEVRCLIWEAGCLIWEAGCTHYTPPHYREDIFLESHVQHQIGLVKHQHTAEPQTNSRQPIHRLQQSESTRRLGRRSAGSEGGAVVGVGAGGRPKLGPSYGMGLGFESKPLWGQTQEHRHTRGQCIWTRTGSVYC